MQTIRNAVHVSLAHRYHQPSLSLSQNRALYGDDHSVEGLGHNMVVWLGVRGELHPETGRLVEEQIWPAFEKKVKKLLDHRCLFEVEPYFSNRVSSVENVAMFLKDRIFKESLEGAEWSSIWVDESSACSARVSSDSDLVELSQRFTWDLDGGTWRFEVNLAGPVNETTGLVAERARVRNVFTTTLQALSQQERAKKEAFACLQTLFSQWSDKLKELKSVRAWLPSGEILEIS